MNAREIGLRQVDAAAIAEFSERTGQRIEAGEHQPNRGRVRDWRSSAAPLAEVWFESVPREFAVHWAAVVGYSVLGVFALWHFFIALAKTTEAMNA